jgi:hypothetical protein
MPRTIVLNSNNVVQDGYNNKLVYKFPNSIQFKDSSIAVQNVSMFYSWYNISANLGNNKFSYYFPVASVMTLFSVTIPDGIYDIPALNAFFQFTSVKNQTYMTTATADIVYFAKFAVNVNLYSIELTVFTIPSAGDNPSGLIPVVVGNYAPVPETFRIRIPDDLSLIFGFPTVAQLGAVWESNDWFGTATSSGIYDLTPYAYNASTRIASYTSYVAPQVNQNSSVYIALNCINNPYAIPSSIIYAVTPNTGIGGIIVDYPPQFSWNRITDGLYNQIVLSILGTNGRDLEIQDPNITVILSIKEDSEIGGKY